MMNIALTLPLVSAKGSDVRSLVASLWSMEAKALQHFRKTEFSIRTRHSPRLLSISTIKQDMALLFTKSMFIVIVKKSTNFKKKIYILI